jgi:hypothetical protein
MVSVLHSIGASQKGNGLMDLTLTGDGADLALATITVKDVTGDGQPDLVITVQGSVFVLINDHGTFRPRRPDEAVKL